MRIDQITPSMRYRNDINSTVWVLQKIIKDIGFESCTLSEPVQAKEKEYIIYHMLPGSQVAKTLSGIESKQKVLFYHGIMPPEEKLAKVKNRFAITFTTTKYLEKDLQKAGYGGIKVLPLPVDLRDYEREPDAQLIRTYDDEYTNILFAGQITPNKKLEETILVFNYYHKKFNPKSRLFLVGSFSADAGYCQKLLDLIKELEIKNIFLPGRANFAQLLAYYRLSHIFLSMSEYEGLPTPLVEAMYLKVPVIAFGHGAVPEVLGGAGCLIDDKDIRETARLLDLIVKDREKREKIIRRQSERVAAFQPEKVFPLYSEAITEAFGCP
ncbi:MAG: glycosyltransferase family 4 protein [Firmicutes bacterium]|nr:glycosyltransferase family 4 protein [Bacillota bacterium]